MMQVDVSKSVLVPGGVSLHKGFLVFLHVRG